MKYKTIDIKSFCNHKMILGENKNYEQSEVWNESVKQENIGVAKKWITDSRLEVEKLDKYYRKMKFHMLGYKAEFDNIICEQQVIPISENNVNQIAFLGFCGYHSYNEKIEFVTNEGCKKSERVHFYHITECIETLYDSEKSSNCFVWLSLKSNVKLRIKYYKVICSLPPNTCKIILPDNQDMHIAAITVY